MDEWTKLHRQNVIIMVIFHLSFMLALGDIPMKYTHFLLNDGFPETFCPDTLFKGNISLFPYRKLPVFKGTGNLN